MRKTTVYDPIVFMWLVDVQGLKLDYLWVYSDLSYVFNVHGHMGHT